MAWTDLNKDNGSSFYWFVWNGKLWKVWEFNEEDTIPNEEVKSLESSVVDWVLKIIKNWFYSSQEIWEIEKILENKDFVRFLLREHWLDLVWDFEILQWTFIRGKDDSHNVLIQIENYGVGDFYINMTDLNKYLRLYNK